MTVEIVLNNTNYPDPNPVLNLDTTVDYNIIIDSEYKKLTLIKNARSVIIDGQYSECRTDAYKNEPGYSDTNTALFRFADIGQGGITVVNSVFDASGSKGADCIEWGMTNQTKTTLAQNGRPEEDYFVPAAPAYFENCLFKGGFTPDLNVGLHPDVLQPWGRSGKITVKNCDMEMEYQGVFFDNQNGIESIHMENVAIWYRNNTYQTGYALYLTNGDVNNPVPLTYLNEVYVGAREIPSNWNINETKDEAWDLTSIMPSRTSSQTKNVRSGDIVTFEHPNIVGEVQRWTGQRFTSFSL